MPFTLTDALLLIGQKEAELYELRRELAKQQQQVAEAKKAAEAPKPTVQAESTSVFAKRKAT